MHKPLNHVRTHLTRFLSGWRVTQSRSLRRRMWQSWHIFRKCWLPAVLLSYLPRPAGRMLTRLPACLHMSEWRLKSNMQSADSRVAAAAMARAKWRLASVSDGLQVIFGWVMGILWSREKLEYSIADFKPEFCFWPPSQCAVYGEKSVCFPVAPTGNRSLIADSLINWACTYLCLQHGANRLTDVTLKTKVLAF